MIKDLLSGGGVLAVAGVYYLGARQILHSSLEDGVGADGLPLILTVLLASLGVMLILRTLLFPSPSRARSAPADGGEYQAPFPRALGFLAIAVGYALIAPIIGYLPAVALLIAAVAMYEGGMRPSWRLAIIAVGGAMAFWLLFVWLLGVRQPAGMFF